MIIKEELKNILFMGLGAIALTGEKAQELRSELLTKGEILYKDGMVKNEELKRDIKEKIKDSITVEVKSTSKEDIISAIKNMSDDEKKELENLLKDNSKNKDIDKNKKD